MKDAPCVFGVRLAARLGVLLTMLNKLREELPPMNRRMEVPAIDADRARLRDFRHRQVLVPIPAFSFALVLSGSAQSLKPLS